MTEHDGQVTIHRRRIGPVGTACRLALTGVTAWSAVNWTSAGIGWFSRTSTIADPGIWLLIGLGIYYSLYQTAESGFGQRWGIRTVVAFAVALVGAGVVALATEGELWAEPLTWLPYGLVLWFFVSTAIAGPISLAQSTPRVRVRRPGRAHPSPARRPRTRTRRRDVVHRGAAPD